MPKELTEPQKLWIEDLRKHPELQGKEQLKKDGLYCCLGRACVVFNENSGNLVKERSTGFENSRYELPDKVQEWLGLEDSFGTFETDDSILLKKYLTKRYPNGMNEVVDELNIAENPHLAWCNDNGYSFLDIANIIESRPKGLFKE